LSSRALVDVSGSRQLELQRRIDRRLALHAQRRALDKRAVVRLRRLSLRATKRLRHSHEIAALGLRNEPG
jgi:hypothetical protein